MLVLTCGHKPSPLLSLLSSPSILFYFLPEKSPLRSISFSVITWKHNNLRMSAIMDSNKLYTLREIPGKGLGLIAAVKILRGTRIISEEPLITRPRSTDSKEQRGKFLAASVAKLDDGKRQVLFSLHNAFEDEETRELGIFRTNALPLGSGSSTGGIFVESSRINHSCIHNAQNTWNENLGKLTIHAMRDIDEGEEITIIYLSERRNRADRQRTPSESSASLAPASCAVSLRTNSALVIRGWMRSSAWTSHL